MRPTPNGAPKRCNHPAQSGFPCAYPTCVKGTDAREFVKDGKIYRRSKIDGDWVWTEI